MKDKILHSLSISGCMTLLAFSSVQAQDQPNVIFFSTDDLNVMVNPLGDAQAITPNLDRLAAMGVTFTNAHAPAPFSAPSRTAIFTGQHASTTGCYNDEIYFFDHPELKGLHTAMNDAGYVTYGAGKLFHHASGSIDMRGWDEFYARNQDIIDGGYNMGYYESDADPLPEPYPYSPFYTKTDREINGGAFLEWGPIANEKEEEMAEAMRTKWICEQLTKQHEKPFFLGVSSNLQSSIFGN